MPVSERGDQDAAQFISDVVKAHPITLFMKGSPNQPQCGFSANAAAILLGYGHPIKHVNVLIDPEVRQGIKDFSSWPTIPQIYVGGEFLGGSDILAQMHQAGELGEIIEAAVGASGQ
jgi:monothiol glutaredoxin